MPTPTPVQPKADDDITASFEAARTRANASPDLAPARTVSLGSAPDHMSAGWEPSVREGASVPPGLPATWDAGRHALADRDKAWDAARQADVDRRGGVIEKLGEPAIAAYTDAQRRQYEPDTLTFAQKAARFGRTAFMLPSQMAEMGISAAKGAAGAVAGPAVDLLGPDTLHPAGGESDEPGVAGRPQTWDAARAANRGEPWKGPRSERWSQEGVGVAKALATAPLTSGARLAGEIANQHPYDALTYDPGQTVLDIGQVGLPFMVGKGIAARLEGRPVVPYSKRPPTLADQAGAHFAQAGEELKTAFRPRSEPVPADNADTGAAPMQPPPEAPPSTLGARVAERLPPLGRAAVAAGKGVATAIPGIVHDTFTGGPLNPLNAPQWGLNAVGAGLKAINPNMRQGLTPPSVLMKTGLDALDALRPLDATEVPKTPVENRAQIMAERVDPVMSTFQKAGIQPGVEPLSPIEAAQVESRGEIPAYRRIVPTDAPPSAWDEWKANRDAFDKELDANLHAGAVSLDEATTNRARYAEANPEPPNPLYDKLDNPVENVGDPFKASDLYRFHNPDRGGIIRQGTLSLVDKDGFHLGDVDLGLRQPASGAPPDFQGNTDVRAMANLIRAHNANPDAMPVYDLGDSPSARAAADLHAAKTKLALDLIRTIGTDPDAAAATTLKFVAHTKRFTGEHGLPSPTEMPRVLSEARSHIEAERTGGGTTLNAPENVLETTRAELTQYANDLAVLRTLQDYTDATASRVKGVQPQDGWRQINFRGMPDQAKTLIKTRLGSAGHGTLTEALVPPATADAIESMARQTDYGWTNIIGTKLPGRTAARLHGAYVTSHLGLSPAPLLTAIGGSLQMALPAVNDYQLDNFPKAFKSTLSDYAAGRPVSENQPDAPHLGLPNMDARVPGTGLSRREFYQAAGADTRAMTDTEAAEQAAKNPLARARHWGMEAFGTYAHMAIKEALVRAYLEKFPRESVTDAVKMANKYTGDFADVPSAVRQTSATVSPFLNWTWTATPRLLRMLGDLPGVFGAAQQAADQAEIERAKASGMTLDEFRQMKEMLPDRLQGSRFVGRNADGTVEMRDVSSMTHGTLAGNVAEALPGAVTGNRIVDSGLRGIYSRATPLFKAPVEGYNAIPALADPAYTGFDPATGGPEYQKGEFTGERVFDAARRTIGPFVAPNALLTPMGDAISSAYGKPPTDSTGHVLTPLDRVGQYFLRNTTQNVDMDELQRQARAVLTRQINDIKSVGRARAQSSVQERDNALQDAYDQMSLPELQAELRRLQEGKLTANPGRTTGLR